MTKEYDSQPSQVVKRSVVNIRKIRTTAPKARSKKGSSLQSSPSVSKRASAAKMSLTKTRALQRLDDDLFLDDSSSRTKEISISPTSSDSSNPRGLQTRKREKIAKASTVGKNKTSIPTIAKSTKGEVRPIGTKKKKAKKKKDLSMQEVLQKENKKTNKIPKGRHKKSHIVRNTNAADEHAWAEMVNYYDENFTNKSNKSLVAASSPKPIEDVARKQKKKRKTTNNKTKKSYSQESSPRKKNSEDLLQPKKKTKKKKKKQNKITCEPSTSNLQRYGMVEVKETSSAKSRPCLGEAKVDAEICPPIEEKKVVDFLARLNSLAAFLSPGKNETNKSDKPSTATESSHWSLGVSKEGKRSSLRNQFSTYRRFDTPDSDIISSSPNTRLFGNEKQRPWYMNPERTEENEEGIKNKIMYMVFYDSNPENSRSAQT